MPSASAMLAGDMAKSPRPSFSAAYRSKAKALFDSTSEATSASAAFSYLASGRRGSPMTGSPGPGGSGEGCVVVFVALLAQAARSASAAKEKRFMGKPPSWVCLVRPPHRRMSAPKVSAKTKKFRECKLRVRCLVVTAPEASAWYSRGSHMVDFDVGIIGGGPAGSAMGAYLARAGVRCVILEGDIFPRAHVGESLVPASTRVFKDLEFIPEMDRLGFVRKFGATWTSNPSVRPYEVNWQGLDDDCHAAIRFDERAQEGVDLNYTWHVDRGLFDQALLQHAHAS